MPNASCLLCYHVARLLNKEKEAMNINDAPHTVLCKITVIVIVKIPHHQHWEMTKLFILRLLKLCLQICPLVEMKAVAN